MRNLVLSVLLLCAIFCVSSASAGPITDSIAYQGQLTDASSNPVPDGPKDLILSIWTDPVAGTMLHSEVVVVTTSKGLFSACIGCASSSFFDIFTDQSVYLQVQLAGSPPMTPRTVMRSVPFSISSSSVHGEATNGVARGRGIVSVKSGSGSGSLTNGKILLDADSDGDGVAEASDSTGVSEGAAGRRINVTNIGSSGQDGVEITATSASRRINVTNIGSSGQDGVEITATSAKHAINTKGTGGTRVASISSSTTIDSALHSSSIDNDGDGVPDGEATLTVIPGTSSMAINVKGTGADKNRVISTTTPDSVVTEQTFEFTNSLLMPALMKAKEKANRTKCSNNLRYQSPIASNEAEFAVDSASSGLTMSADSDGDGIPEAKLVGKIVAGTFSGGPGTVTLQLADIDDDGIPEGEISETVLPTTSSVAIKTKGTGADANRVISSTTDTSNAVTVHSADIDGDGVEDAVVSTSSGVAEVGGIPGGVIAARLAIKTKGTGADPNRSSVSSSSSPSRSSIVCDQDSDGDGLADRSVTMDCDDTDAGITVARADGEIKIKHKGWDGTIKGRMAIETGGAIEVDFGGDGVGFVSQRFGVGVLSPTHPFEHSSGAHLTAGGVWTNASDENLKENFQAVDGAELLEKIEQLAISEWNYKTESDETKHIGPTAQDFQETFGVGSDGKSISTIDPSGIALAAIKELNRKLERESQALRREVDELKKLVSRFAEKK